MLILACIMRCTPIKSKIWISYKLIISEPLLDRIDIHIEVYSAKYNELVSEKKEESSLEIRKRVNRVRQIQLDRYKDLKIFSNAQLTPTLIKKYCEIDKNGKELMKNAFDKLGLSARAHSRILKVYGLLQIWTNHLI